MNLASHWTTKIIASLICLCLFACYTGGNTITKRSAFPKVMEKAKTDKRYFILHSGVDTFAVTSMQVENRREFTVHLDRMDSLRTIALNNPLVLSKKQAHLFMHDSTSYTLDEPHTISFNKVARIELVE
jgi:hypothetical protein